MNGTPVGKQEKWQFPVPNFLLITGYPEREAVQDGSIEPLYQAVRLRMQSRCPGFVDVSPTYPTWRNSIGASKTPIHAKDRVYKQG
ncbi:hypothetical protein TNCV_4326271 [Trichonephila clavipes]|nr:hypothetical protein TNCV_4326271 [Trichonephila clavipes]